MLAILYKNFSKRRNSTKQPSAGVEYKSIEVHLKEDTSKETPVFIIHGTIEEEYNYMLWNNHYYYISDVVSISNDLIEVHTIQDVLATYKEEIGNYNAFVERSASNFDFMISDPYLSAKQDIANASNAQTEVIGVSQTGGAFVCRIVGGSGTGINTYVAESLEAFAHIFDRDTYIERADLEPVEFAGLLIFNPFDYVVSLSYMPLPLNLFATHGEQVTQIKVKWFSVGTNGQTVYRITDTSLVYSVKSLNVPTNLYTDFRKYHPQFTRYTMYIPGVGMQTLPPEFTAYELQVAQEIDLLTGDIFYQFKALNAGALTDATLLTYQGNISTQLQIGSDAFNITGLTESAAMTGVAFAGGNPTAGVFSAISTINNLITPPISVNGSQTSGIATRTIKHIIVSLYNYVSAEYATNKVGRPLYKNVLINTLSGFVKCGGASIEIDGLVGDKEEINDYLNTGFYYE